MTWTELDTWIVITGMLVCLGCALPGTFLMLNRHLGEQGSRFWHWADAP